MTGEAIADVVARVRTKGAHGPLLDDALTLAREVERLTEENAGLKLSESVRHDELVIAVDSLAAWVERTAEALAEAARLREALGWMREEVGAAITIASLVSLTPESLYPLRELIVAALAPTTEPTSIEARS